MLIPNESVRKDIHLLLEHNRSRLGDVYRLRQEGLSAAQIAKELHVASSSFVWNSDRIVRALLEGEVPSAPAVACQLARSIRAIKKSGLQGLQLDTMQYLDHLLSLAEREAPAAVSTAPTSIKAAERMPGIFTIPVGFDVDTYPTDPLSATQPGADWIEDASWRDR